MPQFKDYIVIVVQRAVKGYSSVPIPTYNNGSNTDNKNCRCGTPFFNIKWLSGFRRNALERELNKPLRPLY